MSEGSNREQAEFWSSDSGEKWVRNARVLDAAMAPALERVLEAAALQAGARVLDIGCGSGATAVLLHSSFGMHQRCEPHEQLPLFVAQHHPVEPPAANLAESCL